MKMKAAFYWKERQKKEEKNTAIFSGCYLLTWILHFHNQCFFVIQTDTCLHVKTCGCFLYKRVESYISIHQELYSQFNKEKYYKRQRNNILILKYHKSSSNVMDYMDLKVIFGGRLDFTYFITNTFYFNYLNQLNLIKNIFVDLKVFNCLCKSAIVFVYFDMMLTSHNIFCSLLPKMSFLSSVNKNLWNHWFILVITSPVAV